MPSAVDKDVPSTAHYHGDLREPKVYSLRCTRLNRAMVDAVAIGQALAFVCHQHKSLGRIGSAATRPYCSSRTDINNRTSQY